MYSKTFVNHTNHLSQNWAQEQRLAASNYGKIIDLPFPAIAPTATHDEVLSIATEYAEKIISLKPAAVLCQGEFTYTYALTRLLLSKQIPVFAATSRRISEEITTTDGTNCKISVFRFIQFRPY